MVDPKRYGDSHSHFFTCWTRDTYHTGCYDMDCPGFQLAKGAPIVPGGTIKPVSHVHGARQKITIKVFREKSTRNWWIHYGFNKVPTPVGYYPAKLFDKLSKKATQISIGSVVGGSPSVPSPPMGSGFLPSDKAALITDISLIGQDGRMTPFTVNTDRLESKSSCYSITPIEGAKCSYGGPGDTSGLWPLGFSLLQLNVFFTRTTFPRFLCDNLDCRADVQVQLYSMKWSYIEQLEILESITRFLCDNLDCRGDVKVKLYCMKFPHQS
ncbi:hypothetical protein ZWY2020_018234 [Hordeum vulgare]|nr:hypothetical protein ZWY2020_018234 [Hordeum vulgare]